MSESMAWSVATFGVYLVGMVGIGLWVYKRTVSQSDFVLGGRQLNPWVSALSANASDFSGWLLLGLPGAIYVSGLGEAWIAVGLASGFAGSWILIAPRLRVYTERVTDSRSGGESDSLTLSSFLENRFNDRTRSLRAVSAVLIIVFYFFYVASGLVAMASLFDQVFGLSPAPAIAIGVSIVVLYTVLGGFLAVSYTDVVQAIMMWLALLVVPVLAITVLGGFGGLADSVSEKGDGLMSAFGGVALDGDTGLWGSTETLGWVVIISGLAWGFGYFGQPHILARYMGIRSVRDIPKAAVVSVSWAVSAMILAVLVGFIGIAYFETPLGDPEQVFPRLIEALSHPLVAGLLLAAILAAVMSTADSQLLVAASALTEDGYKAFVDKDASPKSLLWISRGTVVAVALVAAGVALWGNQSVMDLVGYAWAGFGAGFGPVLLLALFWKRMTWAGALAGMVVGGATAIVWDIVDSNYFGTGLYAMVPAVALSFAAIYLCNGMGKVSAQMEEDFDKVVREIGEGETPEAEKVA
ncbi:sodium/proline symporter PutP [Nocardiopsis sp. L17-MgMaSL7]|uniref:sodium/proline symporter PutP n=1 Tax=Nocardiopsis sp. L17-MgMaSL7 TaxID=1938893 RepID=UPI000D9B2D32|nr:sodium/proline symporter PutP [Nocardiopsis sp. L17-MgMaSL7]PWV48569.1 sodium/proline symporter [Nocardiopsis sp. L17-MgMaSL7]